MRVPEASAWSHLGHLGHLRGTLATHHASILSPRWPNLDPLGHLDSFCVQHCHLVVNFATFAGPQAQKRLFSSMNFNNSKNMHYCLLVSFSLLFGTPFAHFWPPTGSCLDSFGSFWAPLVHSLGLFGSCWLHLEPIRGQSGPIEGPQGPQDLDLEPSLAPGALLTHQILSIWEAK